MKSAILYPYGTFRGAGCCRMLHAKHLALTSAVYTLVSFKFFIFSLQFKIEMHLNSAKEVFMPRNSKILLRQSYFICACKKKLF